MDKQHNINYIQCGKFGQDVLNYVTKSTEKLINKLVKEKGITIADNTLEKIITSQKVMLSNLLILFPQSLSMTKISI